MLEKFSVEGFKCFGSKLELDLSRTGNYEFNQEAVADGIVSKGILYGFNGCGKSNLGLALMDIVQHLTDNHCARVLFVPYLNLNTGAKEASFSYDFAFPAGTVSYRYQKSGFGVLLFESLTINKKEVLRYDFRTQEGFVKLKGTENLSLSASNSSDTISRVKYVSRNALLTEGVENDLFYAFVRFVETMLLFYSLDRNRYIGFKNDTESISSVIIREKKVKEFETFLRANNVDMALGAKTIDGDPTLMAKYSGGEAPFFGVASKGTQALALFYYWYIVMERASFVFMDEFDAFYHFELAESVVKTLKGLSNTQVLLTTHNTDLLSNDLLRPDCYFWMDEGKISPLSELSEKEIRKAHNLQKMFKAGAFHG